MGDEGDTQIGAKRKRILFSRRAEKQTKWVVGMTQMQGAKIKTSMFVSRMKSRREYLEGECTA